MRGHQTREHASGPAPFTVEVNRSYDPVQQSWDQEIFIKLYTTALETGFLAALSDRDWKTLCVIALHMDSQGRCYPSRTRIAQALGVSHTTASARIQSLLDVRWNAQPLVRATRDRRPNGTLGRQVYTILPVVPLGFGPQRPVDDNAPEGASTADPTRLRNLDVVEGSNQVKISQHGDVPTWQVANVGTHQHGDLLTSTNKIQDLNKIQENPDDVSPNKPLTSVSDGAPSGPAGETPKSTADQLDPPKPSGWRRPSTRPASPEAKAAAQYLKDQLMARGMTLFARNWHLKAAATAGTLLKAGLTAVELHTLIDWCLAHPFWSDKVTTMDKVGDLAGQWQMEQKGGQAHGHVSGPAAARRHPDSGSFNSLIIR